MNYLVRGSSQSAEAVVQKCSVKKVFLEISKNSQENTCARVSILIKLQARGTKHKTRRLPFFLLLSCYGYTIVKHFSEDFRGRIYQRIVVIPGNYCHKTLVSKIPERVIHKNQSLRNYIEISRNNFKEACEGRHDRETHIRYHRPRSGRENTN